MVTADFPGAASSPDAAAASGRRGRRRSTTRRGERSARGDRADARTRKELLAETSERQVCTPDWFGRVVPPRRGNTADGTSLERGRHDDLAGVSRSSLPGAVNATTGTPPRRSRLFWLSSSQSRSPSIQAATASAAAAAAAFTLAVAAPGFAFHLYAAPVRAADSYRSASAFPFVPVCSSSSFSSFAASSPFSSSAASSSAAARAHHPQIAPASAEQGDRAGILRGNRRRLGPVFLIRRRRRRRRRVPDEGKRRSNHRGD